MKMFKKIAVLAAALMMVSVFVSCDNNAEEAGDGIVAEFNGYVNKFAELPRAAKVIEPMESPNDPNLLNRFPKR